MQCHCQGITKQYRLFYFSPWKCISMAAQRSCHLNLGHMLQALSVSCELHGWIMEEGGIRHVSGPFVFGAFFPMSKFGERAHK